MKEFKISKALQNDLKKTVSEEENIEKLFPLPKYSPGIFNAINRSGNCTSPKYVGSMKEIVPEFIDKFYAEKNKFPEWTDWADYYENTHSDLYNAGLDRLKEFMNKSMVAMQEIIDDPDLIKVWYDKFIFYQNFQGFRSELLIYEFLRKKTILGKKPYSIRLSTPEEESKGIDIVITSGVKVYNINVKPKKTYELMHGAAHFDNKDLYILLYELDKDGNLKIETSIDIDFI